MEFNLFSVNVKISFLFVWLIAILLCFDISDEIRLAVLFSFLHETGHLIAIILTKQRPKQLRFGLFGMTIVRENDLRQDYRQELITSLAGPAVNTALALSFFSLNKYFDNTILYKSIIINTLIAAFNLMPVFSLDGGRALESLLELRFDISTVQKVMKLISFVFIILIDFTGLYLLIDSGYNFTLLVIGIYLTLFLFFKC